ncbi:hypothetical protein GYH30_006404 [Glycine max]|nr:hypothetical protein GYH30_006404 [Glycine max]
MASFSFAGGFDAVAFTDEEVPAKNLGEAVHHVVELLVLHQRAHREPELGDLRRHVVADAISLKELLQFSELARRRRPRGMEHRVHWRHGREDSAWVPLE